MRVYHILLLLLLLTLGGKKPFSKTSETAIAMHLKKEKNKTSVVFIAGYDEGGNRYYTNAKNYFEAKGLKVIDTLFSVDGIIDWLNQNTDSRTEFEEIHIVSHGNAWLGMSLKTTEAGKRITLKTLRDAKKNNTISKVQQGVTGDTKIILHSCGLGENRALLHKLKNTFAAGSAPTVYATTFFNVFGGKFAAHYLAKPYYGFYPTAESPGPMQLAKEFKATYPETPIDWFTALKTRREVSAGEAYSYRFNIPVDWEFTFGKADDIPKFENRGALMDWISESTELAELLVALNIPLEKYRWRSESKGKKLLIKGKTTVLCVLAPLLQNDDTKEYRLPVVEDPLLYQIL